MMHNLTDTRARLEAKIEELIALLDFVDGDCDLEDNGDLEPSIGGTYFVIGNRAECDLEWDTADAEPSGDELDFSGGRFVGGSGL